MDDEIKETKIMRKELYLKTSRLKSLKEKYIKYSTVIVGNIQYNLKIFEKVINDKGLADNDEAKQFYVRWKNIKLLAKKAFLNSPQYDKSILREFISREESMKKELEEYISLDVIVQYNLLLNEMENTLLEIIQDLEAINSLALEITNIKKELGGKIEELDLTFAIASSPKEGASKFTEKDFPDEKADKYTYFIDKDTAKKVTVKETVIEELTGTNRRKIGDKKSAFYYDLDNQLDEMEIEEEQLDADIVFLNKKVKVKSNSYFNVDIDYKSDIGKIGFVQFSEYQNFFVYQTIKMFKDFLSKSFSSSYDVYPQYKIGDIVVYENKRTRSIEGIVKGEGANNYIDVEIKNGYNKRIERRDIVPGSLKRQLGNKKTLFQYYEPYKVKGVVLRKYPEYMSVKVLNDTYNIKYDTPTLEKYEKKSPIVKSISSLIKKPINLLTNTEKNKKQMGIIERNIKNLIRNALYELYNIQELEYSDKYSIVTQAIINFSKKKNEQFKTYLKSLYSIKKDLEFYVSSTNNKYDELLFNLYILNNKISKTTNKSNVDKLKNKRDKIYRDIYSFDKIKIKPEEWESFYQNNCEKKIINLAYDTLKKYKDSKLKTVKVLGADNIPWKDVVKRIQDKYLGIKVAFSDKIKMYKRLRDGQQPEKVDISQEIKNYKVINDYLEKKALIVGTEIKMEDINREIEKIEDDLKTASSKREISLLNLRLNRMERLKYLRTLYPNMEELRKEIKIKEEELSIIDKKLRGKEKDSLKYKDDRINLKKEINKLKTKLYKASDSLSLLHSARIPQIPYGDNIMSLYKIFSSAGVEIVIDKKTREKSFVVNKEDRINYILNHLQKYMKYIMNKNIASPEDPIQVNLFRDGTITWYRYISKQTILDKLRVEVDKIIAGDTNLEGLKDIFVKVPESFKLVVQESEQLDSWEKAQKKRQEELNISSIKVYGDEAKDKDEDVESNEDDEEYDEVNDDIEDDGFNEDENDEADFEDDEDEGDEYEDESDEDDDESDEDDDEDETKDDESKVNIKLRTTYTTNEVNFDVWYMPIEFKDMIRIIKKSNEDNIKQVSSELLDFIENERLIVNNRLIELNTNRLMVPNYEAERKKLEKARDEYQNVLEQLSNNKRNILNVMENYNSKNKVTNLYIFFDNKITELKNDINKLIASKAYETFIKKYDTLPYSISILNQNIYTSNIQNIISELKKSTNRVDRDILSALLNYKQIAESIISKNSKDFVPHYRTKNVEDDAILISLYFSNKYDEKIKKMAKKLGNFKSATIKVLKDNDNPFIKIVGNIVSEKVNFFNIKTLHEIVYNTVLTILEIKEARRFNISRVFNLRYVIDSKEADVIFSKLEECANKGLKLKNEQDRINYNNAKTDLPGLIRYLNNLYTQTVYNTIYINVTDTEYINYIINKEISDESDNIFNLLLKNYRKDHLLCNEEKYVQSTWDKWIERIKAYFSKEYSKLNNEEQEKLDDKFSDFNSYIEILYKNKNYKSHQDILVKHNIFVNDINNLLLEIYSDKYSSKIKRMTEYINIIIISDRLYTELEKLNISAVDMVIIAAKLYHVLNPSTMIGMNTNYIQAQAIEDLENVLSMINFTNKQLAPELYDETNINKDPESILKAIYYNNNSFKTHVNRILTSVIRSLVDENLPLISVEDSAQPISIKLGDVKQETVDLIFKQNNEFYKLTKQDQEKIRSTLDYTFPESNIKMSKENIEKFKSRTE